MKRSMRGVVIAGVIAMAGSLSALSFAAAEHRGAGGHDHQCKHHGKHHGKQHGKQHGKHRGCAQHGGMHGDGGMQGDGRRGWHRDGRIGRLLERFDANKDGELTQAELDASRKELLEKYDTDKDGKLSLSEFETLWLDVRRRRIVRSFQYIDEDGDAAITVEEFVKPYVGAVERMDRNGDGAISRGERPERMRGERGQNPSEQFDEEKPN